MHTPVFYVCVLWLSALLGVNLVLALRRTDSPSAILAVDTCTLVLVAMLLIVTLWTGRPYALKVALMLALLAFIQTLAAARFLARRGLFSG